MRVESGRDRRLGAADDELVVGQCVGAHLGARPNVNRDARVLGLGDGRHVAGCPDPVDRGFGRGGIGDAEEDDGRWDVLGLHRRLRRARSP